MSIFHRPTTLTQAMSHLSMPGIRVLAGGTDLYPATQAPELAGSVVDLSGIADLHGITRDGRGLRIGACTTWAAILRADLPPALQALQAAARQVGGWQIQNAGTIGGNLCNASPAADGVPPLLVLDAMVELAGPDGLRHLRLADFLTGPRRTALRADEVLVAVVVPEPALQGHSRFAKLGARAHLVISIAMIAVRVVTDGDRITECALAVGSCGPVARRLPMVEAALTGAPLVQAASRIDPATVAAALSPITDIRATAAYRAGAAAILLQRALSDLARVAP